MRILTMPLIAGFLACLLHVQTGVARAAEIKFLCAIIMKPVIEEVIQDFERGTGNKVAVEYATAGALRDRIRKGERADLTILPRPMASALMKEGKLTADSDAVVARASVSVGVRAGAPKPDVSSVEAFKRSLLAASSIVYADPVTGSASGVHFARVLEQLGISAEMKQKSILIKDGVSADVAARGEAEIAVAGTPGLMNVPGVDFVGPLPRELQNNTDFVYVASVLASAQQPQEATMLIKYLLASNAVRVIKAKGMEPGP